MCVCMCVYIYPYMYNTDHLSVYKKRNRERESSMRGKKAGLTWEKKKRHNNNALHEKITMRSKKIQRNRKESLMHIMKDTRKTNME